MDVVTQHFEIKCFINLGEANGGAAGGVLPDVAVGAADHGLAAGAQAIPALDLNYVDSK